MFKKLLFIISFILTISCNKDVKNDVEVYNNDFENGDLNNINNGVINQYNGSAVLGNYNNGYFALTLNDLPDHDLIKVTFDLYIHDSWNGNNLEPDGPDIWEMLVDGNPYINTTFSNNDCAPGTFCPPQSYPLNYPNFNNNPKAGAFKTNLPAFCVSAALPNGTTLYKIEKTLRHSKKKLILQCLDKLVQTNTNNPKCDESWSVDNIKIQAITL